MSSVVEILFYSLVVAASIFLSFLFVVAYGKSLKKALDKQDRQ